MNTEELTALHNAVIADPTANALLQARNITGLYVHVNLISSPDFYIWKPAVDPLELFQDALDWACVRDMTAGQARIWEWLTKNPTFNLGFPNVRAAIEAAFAGEGAQWVAVRAYIYGYGKRLATNAERLTSTGVGTESSPAIPTWVGEVSEYDATQLIYKPDGSFWGT